MKKIYIVISVLALAVCGCVREDMDIPSQSDERMVRISLPAGATPKFTGAASTRTVLADDFGVEWQNGDEILLMVGKTAYKLTNVNPDGATALFVGDVPDSWMEHDLRTVLYPYSALGHNAPSGPVEDRDNKGMSKVVIPAVQPLVSGTFARDCNYSVATFRLSEDKPLHFENFGGLVSVTLTGNVTVTSMTITAPDDINGPAYYEVSSAFVSGPGISKRGFHSENYWEGNAAPSKTVTLTSEEGVALAETPQSFYAFVMPVRLAGDYTVSIETKEGKTFTETIAVSQGFIANQIQGLGTFDLICTFADIDGRTVDLDPTAQAVKRIAMLSDSMPDIAGLPEWLDYDFSDNSLYFTPEINISNVERSAEVTITQEGVSSTITFRQATIEIPLEPFGCDSDAAASDVISLPDYFVERVPDWEVIGNEWITPVTEEGSFKLNIAENTTGADRVGTVSLTDSYGNIVSEMQVTQTGFGYYDLFGNYSFVFKDKNGIDSGWRLTFTRHPESERSYAVNAVGIDGADLASYCPDIKIDYESRGEEGPVLKFTGPQNFTESGLCLKMIAAVGSGAIDDYTVGFDLVYTGTNGKLRFDFTPNAMARLKYPSGLAGFRIYNLSDGSIWESVEPRKNAVCLSITKWADNHGGFTEK